MDYEIIYSNRRTLSLCVKHGRLIVRAPAKTPKKKIEETVNSHRAWIEKHIEKQREKKEKFDSLTEEEIKALRKSAKQVLTAKTEYFSKIMGLKYGRISITGAKTRFGSCSSAGNISYSYRLMLYPEEAIDYVVVHELAHLLQMNHSPSFYSIIEAALPDYKRRKMLLKK